MSICKLYILHVETELFVKCCLYFILGINDKTDRKLFSSILIILMYIILTSYLFWFKKKVNDGT